MQGEKDGIVNIFRAESAPFFRPFAEAAADPSRGRKSGGGQKKTGRRRSSPAGKEGFFIQEESHALGSLGSVDHHGQDLPQVAGDAVVGHFEDGSQRVLVDRDDQLGILHAGLVLDGAGDAQSDVDLRTDGLAGLTDLVVGGDPAGVDDGTGGAHDAAQDVSQLLSQLDALLGIVCDALADGDDDFRAEQVHDVAGFLDHFQDLGLQPLVVQLDVEQRGLAGGGSGFVERSLLHDAGTDRAHAGTEAGADDGGQQMTAESGTGHLQVDVFHLPLHVIDLQGGAGAQEVEILVHVDVQMRAVGGQAGVQTGSQTGSQVAADVGGADEEDLGLLLMDHVSDDVRVRVGGVVGQTGIVADDDAVGAVAAQLGHEAFHAVAQQDAGEFHTALVGELAAFGDQLEVGGHELAAALLAEYHYALKGGKISAIVCHVSVLLSSNNVLLEQDVEQLVNGFLAGAFEHLAYALLGRREALEDVGGRTLQTDGICLDEGIVFQFLVIVHIVGLGVELQNALDAHVAGLVQLLDAGDEAGSLGHDGHIAVFQHALDGDLAAVVGDAGRIGDLGDAQLLGDLGTDLSGIAVDGLTAAEDDVAFAETVGLDAGGDDLAGGEGIGTAELTAGDQDGLVGAHGQQLMDHGGGSRRTHDDDDDLGIRNLIAEGQSSLDGVQVVGVGDGGHGGTVQSAVFLDGHLAGGVGNLLDANENIHVLFLLLTSAARRK